MNWKSQTCHWFLYSLLWDPKMKIVGSKILGSHGRIDKRKIAIFNIDSILNWIISRLRNMKVLNFASPKWVYMWKSVEKWLCKTRKYKTLIGIKHRAIFNYSSILKFWKKLLLQYFFYELMFSNLKFLNELAELCNIRFWRPSWIYFFFLFMV
jgi:hypothetical protein